MPKPVDTDDDLPPSEWARARRRDHDAAAGARTGMRTGLAKQFKQVLDAQVKRAREAARQPVDDGGGEDESAPDAGLHPRYHGHHHRHEPQEGPPERGVR